MNKKRPKQRCYDPLAVLAYIAMYQKQHKDSTPSQRHIQAALGISAPSVVQGIVQRLARDGLITTTYYGRGYGVDLTLTEAGRAAVEQWQADWAGEEQP